MCTLTFLLFHPFFLRFCYRLEYFSHLQIISRFSTVRCCHFFIFISIAFHLSSGGRPDIEENNKIT